MKFASFLKKRITTGMRQHLSNLKLMFSVSFGGTGANEEIKSVNVTWSRVHVRDTSTNLIVIDESEWRRFVNLAPILRKYVTRLFYEQDDFKAYIASVVATRQYVFPQSARCDNETYDRLYDKLVMYDKAEALSFDNNVDIMINKQEDQVLLSTSGLFSTKRKEEEEERVYNECVNRSKWEGDNDCESEAEIQA